MQIMAAKCDRCGRIEEQSRTVRVKLFINIYNFEQKEFDLCQCCADEKRNKDKEFIGGL